MAGLPPAWGLSTAAVAGFVAAVLGRSPQVVTGPTNTTGLLVLGALTPWLASDGLLPPESLGILATLTLLVGVIRVVISALGADTLIRFIPESVLVGFTAGAGVMIAAMQLDEVLGLAPLPGRSLLAQLVGVARGFDHVHLAAVTVTIVTAVAMAAARRRSPRLPAALILIVAGAVVAQVFGLDAASGLPLVSGRAPVAAGWPPLALPDLHTTVLDALLVPASAIVLLGTLELPVTAGADGARPDMRREIRAQGWANVAGAFAAGIPASASLTRSALLRLDGARTRLAAASGALLLLPFLVFGASLAGTIPEASLAGVLLVTAWHMVPWESLRRLWLATPETRLLLALTFVATLVLRFEWAIIFGTGTGLVIHLARTSAPRLRLLRPESGRLVPCQDPAAELVVLEVSGHLYYAAVPPFTSEAERLIPASAKLVLVDLSHAHQIRYAALRALERLAEGVARGGAELHLCGVGPETRALIERTGSQLKWHPAEFEPGLSVRRCLESLAAPPDAD
jgi:SulP family sulfate permease